MRFNWIFIFIVAALLGSCTKNEFKIKGSLEGAGTQNLRFVYYASDDKKGLVMESVVPVVNGVFDYSGIIRNPSIIWIFKPDHTLLNVLYVERGNEMTVTGKIDSPYAWKVTGNELQEALSKWQSDNEGMLMGRDAATTSKAVAKYVKENPTDKLSALLLMSMYSDKNRVDERKELWDSLDEDIRDEDLLNAVTGMRQYIINQASKAKVHQMSFCSFADTMTVFSPRKSKVSVLYLWRIKEEHHKTDITALKKIADKYTKAKQLQIADINLDRDTSLWRRDARVDSVDKWERMWAVGAEMNKSISRLNVPRTPYFIVVDSTGTQIYRGDVPSEMENAINRVINKKTK